MASTTTPLSPVATQLLTQALGLSPGQREELAMMLLDSLPDDDSPMVVDEELERLIERRLAEHEAGTARLVDVATFMASVRAAANGQPSP
jgi:putative addiction module component (TIGR02574 family)